MDRNVGSFTVLFQPPFWVGIAERWEAEGYSAARVVFGPEPTDAQIYQWLERERPAAERKNPKRAQREAQAATRDRGVSTRAQEALSRQREQEGLARKRAGRSRREQERQGKYLLRQQKKREKKRGR